MSGGARLSWASLTTVFLLRPTGSHRKQLNWVGLHVVTYIFTKIPGCGGGAARARLGREALGGHCHRAGERGQWLDGAWRWRG